MDIMTILLLLIAFWIIGKWEKYSIKKKYRKNKEEKIRKGLYYDRNKL